MKRAIVNNNGDSIDTLINQCSDLSEKLNEAKKSLQLLTVHGRNYQLNKNPTDDLKKDIDDKAEAMRKLDQVETYLMDSYRAIARQK